MAKFNSFRAPNRAVKALCELTGLSPTDCADLIRAVAARRLLTRWISPIAAPLVALGWIFLFGRITDLLEGTRWDILAYLARHGIVGIAIALLLGYGVAFALAIVAGTLAPNAALRRALFYHLYSPACFWCGYSLRELPRQDSSVLCPECGRHSPVRLRHERPSSARAI